MKVALRAASTRYQVPTAPTRVPSPITAKTLPPQVQKWLADAAAHGLTGSVTLNFVGGELRAWERKETGRSER